MNKPKFRIYKDIICLEMSPPAGSSLWWDAGYGLAFMPVNIKDIKNVKYGKITGSSRMVLVTQINFAEGSKLVAINLPRSDIFALKEKGLWPESVTPPYDCVEYTPQPKNINIENKGGILA